MRPAASAAFLRTSEALPTLTLATALSSRPTRPGTRATARRAASSTSPPQQVKATVPASATTPTAIAWPAHVCWRANDQPWLHPADHPSLERLQVTSALDPKAFRHCWSTSFRVCTFRGERSAVIGVFRFRLRTGEVLISRRDPRGAIAGRCVRPCELPKTLARAIAKASS